MAKHTRIEPGSLSPVPLLLCPFSFLLPRCPLSPSLLAELQEVCRGFVLLLIHITDVVLQEKRGLVMALLGTAPADVGDSNDWGYWRKQDHSRKMHEVSKTGARCDHSEMPSSVLQQPRGPVGRAPQPGHGLPVPSPGAGRAPVC